MLRKTWAREENGDKKVKRVFGIGQVEDEGLANSLVDESDRLQVVYYGDYNGPQCLCVDWFCRLFSVHRSDAAFWCANILHRIVMGPLLVPPGGNFFKGLKFYFFKY